MKRKLVCLLLAVVMLSAMAVTAFAVDINSWPTEIHAGCPKSADMHFYATGTIYNHPGYGLCVEGRHFSAPTNSSDCYEGGAPAPVSYFFGGTVSNPVVQPGWYHYNGSKFEPCHIHSWSYTFDNNQHWQKCASCTETQGQADHSWVRSADGSTTKCETCGAYVTVKATSGVTPKTVKDCVTIETNLSPTPGFDVFDASQKVVALNTSVEGNYQAISDVASGVNPYANFTLTNPKTTAATGDNRPIELLVFGFAAMSVMAAAAFTMDRKRR